MSERLFSYAGLVVQPDRASLVTKTYERRVVSKVNMDNVYILPEDITDEFEARRVKDWDKEQEQECHDQVFLEVEAAIAALAAGEAVGEV